MVDKKSDFRKDVDRHVKSNEEVVTAVEAQTEVIKDTSLEAVLSKKMDESSMKAAAKVGTCIIHYGGKTGKGKGIDMEMSSPYYKFKINIRDTQGKDGYPTRMMCDFTTLKV